MTLTYDFVHGSEAVRVLIYAIRFEQNNHLVVNRLGYFGSLCAAISRSALIEELGIVSDFEPILVTWTVFGEYVTRGREEF
jgi:hypothetical protein